MVRARMASASFFVSTCRQRGRGAVSHVREHTLCAAHSPSPGGSCSAPSGGDLADRQVIQGADDAPDVLPLLSGGPIRPARGARGPGACALGPPPLSY